MHLSVTVSCFMFPSLRRHKWSNNRGASCVCILFTMAARDVEGTHVQTYVMRLEDDVGPAFGFEIVSSQSLHGSEISFLGVSRDQDALMCITKPMTSTDELPEPSQKRFRGYLEPKQSRTPASCPSDIPLETWLSGVSSEPCRLFETKLRFLVAPAASWTVKEVWVCGSTTAGDAKHYLQQHSLPQSEAQLVGLVSQVKIPWHKKLLEGSQENWAPTEDRVLIPSSARLDFVMKCLGVLELCILQFVEDIMNRYYIGSCCCRGVMHLHVRAVMKATGSD